MAEKADAHVFAGLKSKAPRRVLLILVRMTGIEPAHRKIPDPKSGASASSATSANIKLSNGSRAAKSLTDYAVAILYGMGSKKSRKLREILEENTKGIFCKTS